MTVNQYLQSYERSSFCQVTLTNELQETVGKGMHKLAKSCLAGDIAARIITPKLPQLVCQ